MKIRKPLKMFYVDSNWNNFGDKSKYDIPHLMHERNVYLQLVLNFQHPEAWNEFIQDKYVDEVYDYLKKLGSVDLHMTNVCILTHVLALYPECEGMIRSYSWIDLNSYADEALAQIHSKNRKGRNAVCID